jgi:ribosomal protein S18 acetylase RimI-like enzyme
MTGTLPMTVRAGTDDDRPWMIDLARRTVASSVSPIRRPAPGGAEAAVEKLLTMTFKLGTESAVVENSLERLGFGIWTYSVPDEISGEPQAFGIYVAVEPHAQRGGLAKLMFGYAEERVKARGLPYFQFAVTEDNVGARELYAALGYQTERRILCKRF